MKDPTAAIEKSFQEISSFTCLQPNGGSHYRPKFGFFSWNSSPIACPSTPESHHREVATSTGRETRHLTVSNTDCIREIYGSCLSLPTQFTDREKNICPQLSCNQRTGTIVGWFINNNSSNSEICACVKKFQVSSPPICFFKFLFSSSFFNQF